MRFLRISVLVLAVLMARETLPAQQPDWITARGFLGSASSNYPERVATDRFGNVYLTGTFVATISFGSTSLTSNGIADVFLVKFDVYGNVLWAKSVGGTGFDAVFGIAVDSSDNCFITGGYNSTSMTVGSTTLTNNGFYDIFLVKFDPNGNVSWAKTAGGSAADYGEALAVDPNGGCYLTGFFVSTSVSFGSTTLTNAGGYDFFLTKYDPAGNVVYAVRAGNTGSEIGWGVSADAAGNAYATGTFDGTNVTLGSTTLTNNGAMDIFVVKYNPSGFIDWAVGAGSTDYDNPYGISIDAAGNSYVAGYFAGPSITFGSTTLNNGGSSGSSDLFIAKCDNGGNWVWAKSAGGAGDEQARSIATDQSGNSYITGYYFSTSITFGSTTLNNSGGIDLFAVKYDKDGNTVWAKSASGTGYEYSYGIAVDPAGTCYVTGQTSSPTLAFGSKVVMGNGNNTPYLASISSPVAIASANDVQNDQGGKVNVLWHRSPYDAPHYSAVASYNIYRGVAAGSLPGGQFADTERQIKVEGFESYYWQQVGSVDANFLANYSFPAPTLSDSGPQGNSMEYFFVRANAEDPNTYWDSGVDSGYSTDNLPPSPVAILTAQAGAGSSVNLHWKKDTSDPDVGYYEVHRSTTDGFIPGPGNRIGQTSDTALVDTSPFPGSLNYYRVVTLDIHGNRSTPSQQASVGLSVSVEYSVDQHWNLVSIPLAVSSYAKSILYPTAVSNAFAYQNGYVAEGTLANGAGYWLKFGSPQAVAITGLLRPRDSVAVQAGWNLVGSVSSPVAVTSIATDPPGMVSSQFFGYHAGYYVADSIRPGQGYWIKVNQAGKIILAASEGTIPESRIRITPTAERPPMPPDGESSIQHPESYFLGQNYPNPFNPTTNFEYRIADVGFVSLKIFDVLGREVATLVNGVKRPGAYSVEWDATGMPSGVYIYKINAGSFSGSKKLLLLK